jgi:poly(A) polymerase
VPASRTFDEMIKLLQTGHALASIEQLKKQGLHRGVFPVLDVALDEAHRHDGREKFVQLALADTDRRVGEGKPVAPSFMLACMLWHDVLKGWAKLRAKGESSFPSLQDAIDSVFDARIGDISGRGKLAADMREIWMMQPRFERRVGNSVMTLVEQPRFRAGFDFLRLRAEAGEIDAELSTWWEAFSLAAPDERRDLMSRVREKEHPPKRVRANPPSTAVGDASPNADAAEVTESTSDAASDADPAKKRRRRRRRPGTRGPEADAPATSVDVDVTQG